MFSPPPANELQQRQDREHLKLLAVFHFVVAGIAFLGIGFVALHYLVMSSVLSDPNMWKEAQKGMNHPPPEIFSHFKDIFIWFYVFFGAALAIGSVLNLLSGLFLISRKHRIFSVVIAALDCLQVPFGTILGVFTIIVLSRDSVRQLYDDQLHAEDNR